MELQMASPRTRRVLAELRPKDNNNVSGGVVVVVFLKVTGEGEFSGGVKS